MNRHLTELLILTLLHHLWTGSHAVFSLCHHSQVILLNTLIDDIHSWRWLTGRGQSREWTFNRFRNFRFLGLFEVSRKRDIERLWSAVCLWFECAFRHHCLLLRVHLLSDFSLLGLQPKSVSLHHCWLVSMLDQTWWEGFQLCFCRSTQDGVDDLFSSWFNDWLHWRYVLSFFV